MRTRTAVVTLFTLTLAACELPTAPDGPRPGNARRSDGAAAGDLLLYRPCAFDWSGDSELGIICDLRIRHPDGSVTFGILGSDRLSSPIGPSQSWAPDAGAIAYSAWSDGSDVPMNEEIFVVRLSDGAITDLTNDPATDHSPSWSPDGTRIAFASDRDGTTELYLMNADGSGLSRLTYGIGAEGRASWSPDGTRLVFTCSVAGNRDLCSIAADGSALTRLTTDPSDDFDPAFSPDGTRLVFATRRYDPSLSKANIAVLSLDGGGVTRVTSRSGRFGQPAWSPSADRIAYVSWDGGACNEYCDSRVYVVNADGTGSTYLDHGSGPTWIAAAGALPSP